MAGTSPAMTKKVCPPRSLSINRKPSDQGLHFVTYGRFHQRIFLDVLLRQHIEHLDNYMESVLADSAPLGRYRYHHVPHLPRLTSALNAVLHAYGGATGKRLWNSGKSMTTVASPGSLWTGLGQIYVGSVDGTAHAFGFPDERR